jgi:hypothetical protein
MGRSRGVYRAMVEEAADPLVRGRLLVTVPGAGVSSSWAEACLPPVPAAMFALPGVGSSVWVQFEDGDRNRPVWTGVAWETAQAAEPAITSATSLKVRAPVVTVEAGSADFDGVLRCSTLIADTVIASSYTPGAGNVW